MIWALKSLLQIHFTNHSLLVGVRQFCNLPIDFWQENFFATSRLCFVLLAAAAARQGPKRPSAAREALSLRHSERSTRRRVRSRKRIYKLTFGAKSAIKFGESKRRVSSSIEASHIDASLPINQSSPSARLALLIYLALLTNSGLARLSGRNNLASDVCLSAPLACSQSKGPTCEHSEPDSL